MAVPDRAPDGVQVNPSHAVRVSGSAAAEVCDALSHVVREGRRLAKGARPGDVFELVPPDALKEGIRNGTLRAATPGRGDASVLIKNTKTGRIAGKSDLQRVKPTAASVIGPAMWQAMALATQQHYLVEISTKLDGVKAGVDEVLARLNDDRIGSINHLGEVAADAQARILHQGTLSPERTVELRKAADSAKLLWHQIHVTSRRRLERYRDGTASQEDMEQEFAMLARVTHVLVQCSDALVSVPKSTSADLAAAVDEEQDRLHPAIPEFLAFCDDVLEASEKWGTAQSLYESSRPRNRVARRLRVPPLHLKHSDGEFGLTMRSRPAQAQLPQSEEEHLRGLLSTGIQTEATLLVEVTDGGDLLIGSGPGTAV